MVQRRPAAFALYERALRDEPEAHASTAPTASDAVEDGIAWAPLRKFVKQEFECFLD